MESPQKDLFSLETSGHQIHHGEPEKFQNAMIQSLETNPRNKHYCQSLSIRGGDSRNMTTP